MTYVYGRANYQLLNICCNHLADDTQAPRCLTYLILSSEFHIYLIFPFCLRTFYVVGTLTLWCIWAFLAHEIKFDFSLISLSSVNLIIQSTKKNQRREGRIFPFCHNIIFVSPNMEFENWNLGIWCLRMSSSTYFLCMEKIMLQWHLLPYLFIHPISEQNILCPRFWRKQWETKTDTLVGCLIEKNINTEVKE